MMDRENLENELRELLKNSLKISCGHTSPNTGSLHNDFYVYEWYIIETGEIFYVGKGRGNRYKEYHSRAYEAEKIRTMYETDVRFVAENLTEEEALERETNEMLRVLNETQDRLTNRIIPMFAKRQNGYNPSSNTPPLQFLKRQFFGHVKLTSIILVLRLESLMSLKCPT